MQDWRSWGWNLHQLWANGQDIPSKNSCDRNNQVNEDGSVDLYYGPEAPEGKESNWIRTLPGKGWFTIFRLYGPLEGYMDRNWKPSDIEAV